MTLMTKGNIKKRADKAVEKEKTAAKTKEDKRKKAVKTSKTTAKKKSKKMKNLSSLKVIQNYLSKIGGVQAIKLVEIIEKKQKPLKDEEIAKHINSKVTEVRALLNKLNYRGITYYDKRKDQNSGWYHYTWKINEKRMVELLVEEQKKILKKLEERKRLRENYSIFSCMDECIEEPFEVAIEYNFKCPACGNEMKYIEFNKQVKKLEKEIGKIKVALDGLTII